MIRELEADGKRVHDLKVLNQAIGHETGTGIFVRVQAGGQRESVDVCTLTDASLSEWLEGIGAAELRRVCKVLLGRPL